MSKITLNKQEFTKWLQSYHPRSRVGTPGLSQSCPIATFLKQKYKTNDVSVGVCIFVGEREIPVNNWVTKFIDQVDDAGTSQITAQKALQLLK